MNEIQQKRPKPGLLGLTSDCGAQGTGTEHGLFVLRLVDRCATRSSDNIGKLAFLFPSRLTDV
jgi:hypothetical protein